MSDSERCGWICPGGRPCKRKATQVVCMNPNTDEDRWMDCEFHFCDQHTEMARCGRGDGYDFDSAEPLEPIAAASPEGSHG